MRFEEVILRLRAELAGPRRGTAAQRRMSPRPDYRPEGKVEGYRDAAGLVLLVPRDDRAHVVLTVRTSEVAHHRGQVSFPGGMVEAGEAFEQAALREAHEEIGVPSTAIHVMGALTPLNISASGFRLHPFLATAASPLAFSPADREVARIVEVPLDVLVHPDTIGAITFSRGSESIVAPSFCVEGLHVWGATAMVLSELLTMLGWSGPPSTESR